VILNSLLIAAGLSSRMGEFKPLLLYKNNPLIITIINKIAKFSNKVFVVTGYKEKELISEVRKDLPNSETKNKIIFVSNPDFEKGMFSSLQAGLEAARECDWLLYHFVDQPFLPEIFYSEFCSQIDEKYDWIQPAFNGRKGHPVLIRNSLFKEILGTDKTSSLKELICSKNIIKKIWSSKYKEILNDLDTPEDYKKLLLKK
jgi:molybdenum cofactor cytidylyltransferase